MIRKAIEIFRSRGISGLLRTANSRLKALIAGRAKSFQPYKNMFVDRSGIEIGGPSQVFSRRGIFPVYPLVEKLDNCNFSSTTVWGDFSNREKTHRLDSEKKSGQQLIAEATDMTGLSPETYDFVLSSHMLEHSANPILALSEWKRMLKDNGMLVLLLPDKKHTFDHRRSTTTMAHLIADFDAGMTESDLTHLPEILALHDLGRDPEAGDMAAFQTRSMLNIDNRCLHHHVFDTRLAVSVVEHVGLQVLAAEEIRPHHILLLAQKVKTDDF
jgi:SAM-dependent methyltransferase